MSTELATRPTKDKGWASADDVPAQDGKLAVITGANSGLGLHTARVLAQKGAHVVMACRNVSKAEAAAAEVRAARAGAIVEVAALDLADLDSVARFADELGARHRRLDLLVNNAGLMAIPAQKTRQGFEMQLGTNHVGHFALTARLWPLLAATPGARVVNVSSLYHRRGRMDFDDLFFDKRPYKPWTAYAQSKLANLLFTVELARRAAGRVLAVAAHPGYAATELQGKGPAQAGSAIMGVMMKISNALFAQSAARGALPQLRAATDGAAAPADYFGPAGLFEARGPAVKVGSTNAARDPEAAARLWQISEQLTGVTLPG
jgi:NAD(P)-dependent dehydrogenase (short-subunit alcohol dehydrogenase family)